MASTTDVRRNPALDLALLDELALGVFIGRAPDGEVVLANRAFCRILGRDPVAGTSLEQIPQVYGLVDRQGAPYPVDRLPFCRVLATGEPVVVDDIVVHREDGARVCLRAFATPIRDSDGTISLVATTFMETTTEVEATEARQRAEERLSFAVQNAPIVVWMTDREGIITLSEGAALAGLGLRPGEVVGTSIYELYKDFPLILDNHRRATAGELVSYTGAVGDLYYASQLAPVRARDGSLAGVIGVATDITESRQLEQQVVAADRVHAIGTLAASVAHEINNPLTYMLANVDLATAELERAAAALRSTPAAAIAGTAIREAIDLLAPVRSGAERVRRITEDLRTFTRGDEDGGATCDVLGGLRRALEMTGKDLQARARLVVDLAPGPLVVRGSELRLSQVFLNLLVNAWQALPEPDPRRHEISVRAGPRDGFAWVEIADSGSGVSAANRGRVFDPFFTTKPVGTGTGLGLFVCRNIVHAAGGDITLEEREGGGTVVRVRLPLDARRASSPTPVPIPDRGELGAAPPARVLVVDDNELVADALMRTLRAIGIDAQVAHDGLAALERLLAGDRFDLVYVDVMMRGMTGIELVDALAERAPHLLDDVVLMTGGAFTPEARAFVESQQREVVQKPFAIANDARVRLASRARG